MTSDYCYISHYILFCYIDCFSSFYALQQFYKNSLCTDIDVLKLRFWCTNDLLKGKLIEAFCHSQSILKHYQLLELLAIISTKRKGEGNKHRSCLVHANERDTQTNRQSTQRQKLDARSLRFDCALSANTLGSNFDQINAAYVFVLNLSQNANCFIVRKVEFCSQSIG